MCIKFCGLIFHAFDWQENLWSINFRGYGGMVGTIIVGFTSYCGLIVVDKRHTTKSTEFYKPQKFLHIQYVRT